MSRIRYVGATPIYVQIRGQGMRALKTGDELDVPDEELSLDEGSARANVALRTGREPTAEEVAKSRTTAAADLLRRDEFEAVDRPARGRKAAEPKEE